MLRRGMKRKQTTKRAPQLDLPNTRKRDKNGGFRGGCRLGAGRPKRPISQGRSSEPHRVRPALKSRFPLHVVMRTHASVGSLRTWEALMAVREATIAVLCRGETFRIVHFSMQRNHVHLIVEALDSGALSRGMQAFGISCAKHINAAVSARTGVRRKGAVFTDRYFARPLRTPREVRNCLSYVLNNWRHHRADVVDRDRTTKPWKIDFFSSSLAFDGWKERPDRARPRFRIPPGYEGASVRTPSTWLLSIGWRRYGLISVYEVPGGGGDE